eukprot:TRINITY_DN10290_c0_g2_i1.p1 TRINITY_DN10290_c0_g2~~TRINITY_DN10290_c0_g2_i1.p1  ORF type:complete len:761 (-),score=125.49 TRINITY_DN10290_c0_g2_i1:85-2367(-)
MSSDVEPPIETLVALRVVRATLTTIFDGFGRMDPFVKVFWKSGEGKTWEASTTRVHTNGHTEPVWDHTCRGQPYNGRGSGDSVWFDVLEKDILSSDFCGRAVVTVDDLLGDLALADEGIHAEADERILPITRKGKPTGELVVQAMLVRARGNHSGVVPLTYIPNDTFESPVKRIGFSGGTAPFFSLVLRDPGLTRSVSHYIGKDLNRAIDEVDFYELVRALREHPHAGGLRPLIDFMPEYLGIFTSLEFGQESDEKPKELLVMSNLSDGCKKLRLLDIKIGQKTSQAGWKGKSRGTSLRQSVLDGLTNSAAEGFRLEGFESRPPSLASMDPLIDLRLKNEKLAKKGSRFLFQRMTGAEVLMHFLDVHQEPADPGSRGMQDVFFPMEVTEYVFAHIVKRMTALALACRKSPVPQKWIGSSVGIGFDVGDLPSRSTPLSTLLKAVKVNIFDWGRSELNTLASHHGLSDDNLRDRAKYWSYYRGGIDRLCWEVVRTYRHRFCVTKWEALEISLSDFDSMTTNDHMHRVVLPLKVMAEQDVPIGKASLRLSIDWRSFPQTQDSRLSGEWRITIVKATKLPLRDRFQAKSTSDPFCQLVAMSKNGALRFAQVSCVSTFTSNPIWNETFSVPVALEDEITLSNLLSEECVDIVIDEIAEFFPHGDAERDDSEGTNTIAVSRGFASWRTRLDETAKKRGIASEEEMKKDLQEAEAATKEIAEASSCENIIESAPSVIKELSIAERPIKVREREQSVENKYCGQCYCM